jgi:hypothetical protein
MTIANPPTRYQIYLQGHLEQRWLPWFEGLEITLLPEGDTLLCGPLDRSALYGVLSRIRDLGLELISIQREPDPAHPG